MFPLRVMVEGREGAGGGQTVVGERGQTFLDLPVDWDLRWLCVL